jgi:hypothetical protein
MRDAVTAVPGPDDLRARNRGVLRVLLLIVATLLVAGLLVGIRW